MLLHSTRIPHQPRLTTIHLSPFRMVSMDDGWFEWYLLTISSLQLGPGKKCIDHSPWDIALISSFYFLIPTTSSPAFAVICVVIELMKIYFISIYYCWCPHWSCCARSGGCSLRVIFRCGLLPLLPRAPLLDRTAGSLHGPLKSTEHGTGSFDRNTIFSVLSISQRFLYFCNRCEKSFPWFLLSHQKLYSIVRFRPAVAASRT